MPSFENVDKVTKKSKTGTQKLLAVSRKISAHAKRQAEALKNSNVAAQIQGRLKPKAPETVKKPSVSLEKVNLSYDINKQKTNNIENIEQKAPKAEEKEGFAWWAEPYVFHDARPRTSTGELIGGHPEIIGMRRLKLPGVAEALMMSQRKRDYQKKKRSALDF